MKLWVDDLREAPDATWVHALTSEQAIAFLFHSRMIGEAVEVLSLDHDLGMDESDKDDTTRPIVIWMIENQLWPEEVRIHSSNPVGREWLQGMLNRYAPDSVKLEWNN